MARKSIFMGLSDSEANYQLKRNLERGDRVTFGFTFDGKKTFLSGTVFSISILEHGTLLFVQNYGYQQNDNILPGWRIVPVWLSECGQSGILAPWKDPTIKVMLDAFLFMLERELEQDADNCMAL